MNPPFFQMLDFFQPQNGMIPIRGPWAFQDPEILAAHRGPGKAEPRPSMRRSCSKFWQVRYDKNGTPWDTQNP